MNRRERKERRGVRYSGQSRLLYSFYVPRPFRLFATVCREPIASRWLIHSRVITVSFLKKWLVINQQARTWFRNASLPNTTCSFSSSHGLFTNTSRTDLSTYSLPRRGQFLLSSNRSPGVANNKN